MRRYTWKTFARSGVLWAIVLLWISPMFYPVMMSFKTTKEAYRDLLALPASFNLSNYQVAWSRGNLGTALLNTAVITVCTVLILIVIGSMCAYTIARKQTRRWTVVYMLFVVGTIMPYKLGLLPTYVVFNQIRLTGSFLGMILLQVGIQIPTTVFLYTGFARAISPSFDEAAQIDGAKPLQIFWQIIFPLMGPVTSTVAIQTGIAVWNEFFMSLIFLGGSKATPLSVALYNYIGDNATQWNLVFASVVISLLPVMLCFLLLQKQMVKGFAGGIKS